MNDDVERHYFEQECTEQMIKMREPKNTNKIIKPNYEGCLNFDKVFHSLELALNAPQSHTEPLDDMVNRANIFIEEYQK